MHSESMREMQKFADMLPTDRLLRIGDVGSQDINGCYRRLFLQWDYVGLDIVPGPNVDVVLNAEWSNAGEFDVVISGQTLEHVRQPWDIMRRIATITKPGGKLCIIAPHTFPFHEYPEDCWRIWPDGMRGLFEYVGFRELSIYKNDSDTIGIGERLMLDARYYVP